MTTTMKVAHGERAVERLAPPCNDDVPGILVSRTPECPQAAHPRITAFVWGSRVQPGPTLPYGRARRSA